MAAHEHHKKTQRSSPAAATLTAVEKHVPQSAGNALFPIHNNFIVQKRKT